MEDQIDNYFLTLPEPEQSALLFLHLFLMNEIDLQFKRKFNTPFYYYKGKWFCFVNYDSKKRDIYISFVKGNQVTHSKLLSEGRKQMRIYKILAEKNININELRKITDALKKCY